MIRRAPRSPLLPDTSLFGSAAQAMTGGVVSCTEMVWLHVAVLPHSSVATQVRLVEYLILPAGQLPRRAASLFVRMTAPQPSVGTGSLELRVAGDSMVVLDAQ